ncbi:MAG: hypothetical protein JW965_02715 [Bacteroidales bacterium]|nr:hypothetical protein [Bacteroidales bacterium]
MRHCITSSLVLLLIFLCFPKNKAHGQEGGYGAAFRLHSWEKHLNLEKNSPYKNLEWRAVGPEQQSSRVETIALHPDDPNTVYMGFGSGNLWKTDNNGTTWKPIFENEATFALGCVAISPSDPDIVWVGTGEVLMARSSYAGLGAYKSTDGGKTWENMGLEDTYHIPRIIIDPEDPDIVYVAAVGHNFTFNEERGIYKSTDGGDTWNKILYISDNTGAIEIAMDPSDSQTLLAVTWERERHAWMNTNTGEGSGIYKTNDGGKSWKRLTNGFPAGENVGRAGIAFAPSNPDIVYAIVDNHEPSEQGNGRTGEIYRSDDKGETWEKTHEGRLETGIGYDFCLVRVAPDNPDEIFVCGQKLIRSTDGGKTFDFVGETIVHILNHDIKALHLDMHELRIDPANSDRLLLGNDGGLYMSYDRGNTWLHFNNIPVGEFYAVYADDNDPYYIYGGTQDNAALYGPGNHDVTKRLTDYGVEDPWEHIYLDRWGGGDSYFTYPDRIDPDKLYYEHQFGELRRKNMKTGETVSIRPRVKEGEPEVKRNWMTPFFLSKYDPSIMYYGGNQLYKSNDRGDTWTVISPDLSTNPGPERQGNIPFGTITTLSESELQQGLIYAGTDDGNIQVTKDDGKSWTRVDNDLPEKWVTHVCASQHDLSRVYATLTGYRDDDFNTYIYVSGDFGRNWKDIASNLPPEPVNILVEDPRSKDILYVGTDLGVYVTNNGGKSWHSLCNNLPTTPVYYMVIQERELDLVAGTHGRSVFVIDIEEIK